MLAKSAQKQTVLKQGTSGEEGVDSWNRQCLKTYHNFFNETIIFSFYNDFLILFLTCFFVLV